MVSLYKDLKILELFNNKTQESILEQYKLTIWIPFIEFIYNFVIIKSKIKSNKDYFKILTIDIGFNPLNKNCESLFLEAKKLENKTKLLSLIINFLDKQNEIN